MMYTVLEVFTNEIIINKSKFIGIFGHLDAANDFKEILSRIKKEHPKATHFCYSYCFNNMFKSSDDGEPSGTAGVPIQNVISNNKLSNVYLIVVRYFGGVKLGASNLLRAYADCAKNVVSIARVFEYVKVKISHLQDIDYKDFNLLENYAKKNNLILENISYRDNIDVDIVHINDIASDLSNLFKGETKIKETRIEERLAEKKL